MGHLDTHDQEEAEQSAGTGHGDNDTCVEKLLLQSLLMSLRHRVPTAAHSTRPWCLHGRGCAPLLSVPCSPLLPGLAAKFPENLEKIALTRP
jgi:hypothetical protein